MKMNKLAYLFAGQGSQYVGMGKDLYDSFPEAKAVFDKADLVLGFKISQRCFNGPAELLKQTVISQPAILTMSIAAYEVFKKAISHKPLAISYMAGLSLGEYSALIAAGALSFEEGLRLVRKRAEIMEEAVRKNPGKMAAVLELSFEAVKQACLHSGAEIANINAPGQIVITGKKDAVEQAMKDCAEAGAKKVIELEVGGAFHSSLMFDLSVELKAWINKAPMQAPLVPVISNYTAEPQFKVGDIQRNLVFQLYSPVKWEASMKFMLSSGVRQFYEFGPGKVLRGLMRRIGPEAQVVNIEKTEDIRLNS